MEQHRFKIIESNEDDIYRIIDLTDSSIVGITEMYETDDKYEREWRAQKTNDIKTKRILAAKIVGYGIFICLDTDNMKVETIENRDYLRAVLRQMAKAFEEYIKENPNSFVDYYVPQRKRTETSTGKRKTEENGSQALVAVPTTVKVPNEDKPLWDRLHPAIKVVLVVIGVAAYVALVAFVGLGVLALLAFLLFLPALNKKTKW